MKCLDTSENGLYRQTNRPGHQLENFNYRHKIFNNHMKIVHLSTTTNCGWSNIKRQNIQIQWNYGKISSLLVCCWQKNQSNVGNYHSFYLSSIKLGYRSPRQMPCYVPTSFKIQSFSLTFIKTTINFYNVLYKWWRSCPQNQKICPYGFEYYLRFKLI